MIKVVIMKYSFTITINMIAILKTYFIGFVIAYFLALFFILNTRTKNEKKHFIFINKAIIVSLPYILSPKRP